MDKVKFHDREVPVLLDFQRMGDAVDDAIKAVLSNFVVNTNTVFQGFNVTQNSPLGLSVKVNEGPNGISLAVKSDGDMVMSIGSYSLTVIPNASAVVKAIVIGKEAHQDSDQEDRYFRDIDGSLAEQPVYTKEVLQSIEIEDVKIIHGTPGGAMPEMSGYADYIKLAEITIPAGATAITNAMIKNVDACATWEADTATTHRKVMPSAFHAYQNNDGKYVIMYGTTTLTKLFEIDSSGNITTIGNLVINGTLSGISTVSTSTVNATTGNIATVNATTGNFTRGYGIVPIGAIIPIAGSISGAESDANMKASGYALCNGTSAATQGILSPVISATMPQINNEAYLRGNTSSWTTGVATGGANTKTIASENLPTHVHAVSITSAGRSAGHTHSGSTSVNNASHSHSFSATTGTESANHSHSGTTNANSYWSPMYTNGQPGTNYGDGGGGTYFATQQTHTHGFSTGTQSATHTHSLSGTSGTQSANHQHSFTTGAESVDHTHGVSGNTGNGSFANSALNIEPKYFDVIYWMRVK